MNGEQSVSIGDAVSTKEQTVQLWENIIVLNVYIALKISAVYGSNRYFFSTIGERN